MVGNIVDRKTCVAEPVMGSIEYSPLQSCDVVVTDQNIRCTYKDGGGTAQGYTVYFDDVKGPSVIAGHAHKMKIIELATGKECPVYEVKDGQIAIKGKQYPIKLSDGFYIIRKLTVTECKRLQTVPESYIFPVSDTQAYKMLGNGWTVDVIAHLLGHIPGISGLPSKPSDKVNWRKPREGGLGQAGSMGKGGARERAQLSPQAEMETSGLCDDAEPVEVLSMYDGMSCGHIALDKLGARISRYYATEIDKYAIQTTQRNYPETVQLGDAFQVRNEGWSVGEENGCGY